MQENSDIEIPFEIGHYAEKADKLLSDLAKELDKSNVMELLSKTAGALETLPIEIVIHLISKNIGIQRIIKHSLDETVAFGKILNKIESKGNLK